MHAFFLKRVNMAEFKEAFENTLRFEDTSRSGKVTIDAGGRTRFGIAEKFHGNLPEDFFTGPADAALREAEAIEERDYWAALRLGEIQSQPVANKLFDMAVNMGVRQAAVLAQRAANGLFNRVTPPPSAAGVLTEDGVLGVKTLAAINSVDPAHYLQLLRELSADFYRHVAAFHPAETVDLQGWLRRAEA
jgi:lysozyme family protein